MQSSGCSSQNVSELTEELEDRLLEELLELEELEDRLLAELEDELLELEELGGGQITGVMISGVVTSSALSAHAPAVLPVARIFC